MKKSLIRISCILFSLIIATSCALYLSSGTVVSNNNRNNHTEFEVMQAVTEDDNFTKYDTDVSNQSKNTSSFYKKSSSTFYNDKNIKTNNFLDSNENENEGNELKDESKPELAAPSYNSSNIYSSTPSKNTNSSSIQSQMTSSCTTSSCLPTSSQVSSSNQTTSDNENNPITTELTNSIALSLSNTYNIKVLIARLPNDYTNSLVKNYANDNNAINTALLSLSRFLSLFPNGFIQNFNINQFILVGEHEGDNAVSLTTDNNNKTDLIFDCSKMILTSDVLNIIANMMAKNIENNMFNIDTFNPANFIYGVPKSEYLYSSKNQSACYFINSACQQNKTQDLSETIAAIILNPNKLIDIPNHSTFMPKIKACCFAIKASYPLLSKNKAISIFTNQ